MKKLIGLLMAFLMISAAIGAHTETDTPYTLSFKGNVTTGYSWSGFVLGGSSAELLDGAGRYVPDAVSDQMVGAGGVTVFELKPVKPGHSVVVFTYRRPWEDSIAQKRVYDAYVDENLQLTCTEIPESGVITGTVISADAANQTVQLDAEALGEVIAQFDAGAVLPVPGERVTVYTDGTMALSLPGIVHVLAWESVPAETARTADVSLFEVLTGFNGFKAALAEDNEVVSAYFSEGMSDFDAEFTTVDAAEIRELLDAAAMLEIDTVSDLQVEDYAPCLNFTTQKGDEWSLRFDGRNLSIGGVSYELSGDEALWRLITRLKDKYIAE